MPLAAGGMARIYIAKTGGIAGFERHVVLKLILPERMHDQNAVGMFLDEARLAASLNHHNVAQVFEVGNDGGVHYLAMEYVHGQDLRALLAKAGSVGRRLPIELGLTIVAAAAAGLHHAHERRAPDGSALNIVHRDISPSNIMLGYDGAVKVLDFGIAKAEARNVETQAGMIKGKFAYMSPEQCRGRDVDRRSDVFALGIILYEATTQHRCFRADNDFDTMHRVVTGDVIKPSRVVPGYPPALEAVVLKALATDPAQRYQTAGLMLEAIEAYAKQSRTVMSTVTLGRYMHELFGDVAEPWAAQPVADLEVPRPEGTVSNYDRAPTARPGSIPEIVEDSAEVRPATAPPQVVAPPTAPVTLLDDGGSLPQTDEDDDDAWERAKSYPVVSTPSVASSATIGPGAGLMARQVTAAASAPEPEPAPAPRVLPLTPDPAAESSLALTTLRLPRLAGADAPAPAPPSGVAVVAPPAPRGNLRYLVIGLLLAGAAVAAFALIRGGGGDEHVAAPARPPSTTPAGMAAELPTPDAAPGVAAPDAVPALAVAPGIVDAAPAVAVADATPAAPAEVTFIVKSTPSGAEVLEDGRVVGTTPFTATRAAADGRVQFVVRQRGYLDSTASFAGDRGGTDSVRLKRREAAPERPAVDPKPTPRPTDCRRLGEPVMPGQAPKPLCPD
ncbi:MAG: protein kinase [Kofleriaceae bacterium]